MKWPTAIERYRETINRLGLTPSLAEHRASLYLLRHGQTFMVHFGITNAPEKAKALRAGMKRLHWRHRAR